MKRTTAIFGHVVFALVLVATITPVARGQVAALGKGHQFFVNNGLQIWGLDQGASGFNYNNLENANFNGVLWSWTIDEDNAKLSTLSSGQKWGKWTNPTNPDGSLANPANALDAFETSRIADLIALQVGDEQQADLEDPDGSTKAWFQSAHAGNHFSNQLLYVNSFFIGSDGAYATFIGQANPDAISFDSYPFDTPYGSVIFPHNWLSKAGHFRRHALSSYLSIGGNAPRPYGMYLQTYASSSEGTRHPGEVEMRWQQFTAWTMGYTFVDAFTVGGASSLFNGGNMSSISEPRYSQFAETARQSMNLGPALVRLISYGYGPSIVIGQDAAGTPNIVPSDWLVFNKNNAPPNQQYLTSVSATNIGTKNNGKPGDVYVGFFNPLHESFGDPAGTAYFMVTNALGPYLDDPTATVLDTMQQITLDFDFGATTINSLQRLSRDTGQVELVPLTYLTDNKYRLVFNLEGGTGDLFKFNDGTPFVGIELPEPIVYWDNDGNAGNNNLTTGGGLGGSGNWDSSANKWFNGSANAPWAADNNAVFWGTAGTVTLSAPRSATSLSFKTSGYAITGSTLTMTGPFVTVDAGVTATIGSAVAGSAGLVKNGPGTLNLTANNFYTGGTTINEGVLGIVSGALGSEPASPAVNIAINNGAVLRFDVNNLTLSANRRMILGSNGGASIDTNGNNGTVAGVISGGPLIKTGAGALKLSATNSHAATRIEGGALVVTSDANLGAAPASFTAGNITLDGGSLRFGANFDVNDNRGITIEAGGGSIDTQGFTNPAGYDAFEGGFRGPGDLTKLGSGTFFAAATTSGANDSWKGRLIIKEGTWKIRASDGLPYNPPVADGLQPAQVTLDGGTWQIDATKSVTNGRRGVTIAAGGGTIDTQGFSLTWAGPWAGNITSAVLNKIGSGTLRLNSNATYGPGTYAGILHVNGGTLQLDGGSAMGDLATINLADTDGAALNITGSGETIGSLAGGGENGGHLLLSATLTTGGNNASTTFSGFAVGLGGITKTGSGTFTLAPPSVGSAYSGLNTISGGTLSGNTIANQGTHSAFGRGNFAVSNGATMEYSGVSTATNRTFTLGSGGGKIAMTDTAAVLTISGTISGSGGLTKRGPGAVELNTGKTYSGGTIVEGGALLVTNTTGSGTGTGPVAVNAGAMLGGTGTISGNITSSGRVAPGNSAGTLHLGGSYTQNAAGALEIELASASSFDRLDISGAASLAGTLAVALSGGYMPAGGEQFEILASAGLGGTTFTNTILPPLAGNLSWNVAYGANSVTLEVTAAGLPGDYNSDGAVDAADYVVWRKGLGTTYNQNDYDDWRSNFGAQGGSGAAANSDLPAVPEPATWGCLLLSGIQLISRRRRL